MSKYSFAFQDEHSANISGSKDYLYSDYKPKKKRNRTILVLAIVVVALCLILGLGLGLGLKKKNENKSSLQQGSHGDGQSSSNISTTTLLSTTNTDKDWIEEPCIPHSFRQQSCPWDSNPLLVISLDGFRADYLTRNLTPTLQRLASCGVHTPYMRSVYPTLTFPNHYSIVTGLYPESHGIVYNNMYDPKLNKTFTLFGEKPDEFYGGEPLWITAKKQGKKSAAYFWVGSDFNISGYYPDIWKKYDGSIPFEERVDTVLQWLSLPVEQRPDFLLLYYDEPDHTGHGHGPDSKEVNEKLIYVDSVISRLMNGLYKRNMHNCVNLIILADHGMEKTSCNRRVFLNRYINIDNHYILDGTIGRIYKDYYQENDVVKKNKTITPEEDLLKSLECKSGQIHAMGKSDVPVRHHYTNNDRIGDIVIDVQPKYMVAKSGKTYCLEGNHGFDNMAKSMQAMFIAHGPGFKQDYNREPFENIELYNLMAELIGVTPASNNGTLGSLDDILFQPATKPQENSQPHYPTCSSTNSHATSGNKPCLCSNQTFTPVSSDSGYVQPFGLPVPEKEQACILRQQTYNTGYSQNLHLPLWTSFSLDLQHKVVPDSDKCLVEDPRIEHVTCVYYQSQTSAITYTFLYKPDFADSEDKKHEARLTSNIVPMYNGFENGIWQYTMNIVEDYARQTGSVDITIGTAFDYKVDGLWESPNNQTKFVDSSKTVPIPTHFYIILMKCSDAAITDISKCPYNRLDILSFILPHKQKVPDCMPEDKYLLNNVARIRDIELLTGFRFLSKFPNDVSAKLRTFLPTSLWKTQYMSLTWKDLPCNNTEKNNQTCPGKIPVLLISLDGFRSEYLQRHLTPVIQKMRTCGVHTPYMRSVYPTVTFPNHYTIVTGLYPESHGIISNNMYDENIGEVFGISTKTKMDPRWWGGEPIWTTVKKQNKKSATFFWPGSDVNISGIYPDIWKLYDGSVGYPERTRTVIEWLTLPEDQKPDFITLYFDEPDHAGHASGPDSENVNSKLQIVDGLIGQLMDTLYHKDLHNCVNIILIADHGFDSVSCSQIVKLPSYMDVSKVLIWDGTFGRIQTDFIRKSKYSVAKSDNVVPVDSVVKELMCKNAAMKVFTKESLPRRHHYFNNDRIGEILLDIRREWLVSDTNSFYCSGGNHGWDNIYKTMHALFVAHGPGFKRQIEIDPFENIELYNLMAELLDINPAPNNGTIGSLHHILYNPKPLNVRSTPSAVTPCGGQNNTVDNKILQPICSCSLSQNFSLDGLIQSSDHLSIPFGTPALLNNESSACLLSYPKISTLYDKDLKSPLWCAFNLSPQEVSNNTLSVGKSNCLMKDPALGLSTRCTDYEQADNNITLGLLYHPGLVRPTTNKNIHFVSSAVPMYNKFRTGIWGFTWKLIRQYIMKYGAISVIAGPVYDADGDGLVDTTIQSFVNGNTTAAVPSHLYIIMMKCRNLTDTSPCGGEVDVQSFVLPQLPKVPNCLYNSEYLKDNIARVRDIEELTGLQFFTSGQFTVAKAARLRTYLPVDLWSADLLLKWIDTPCPSQPKTCPTSYQPLLLVSLDGFRADYLIRNFTPYVRKLSECGVHAPYMRSVYPTKTFPNHYTIVTGLYPESHGIIDNNMYDPDIGDKFSMSGKNSSDTRWWGGEPIWNTVVKNNKTAACYFWVGSGFEISGLRPTFYKDYDGKVPYDDRVDQILSWIDNEQPDFLSLYFDEPDHAGHSYGPDDIVKIGQALSMVDEVIGRLMEGLYHRDMHDCVNIMITADHGMADTSCDRLITFRDYLTRYYDMYIYEGAFGRINNKYKYARKGLASVQNPESVSNIIANLTCKSPHFDVYKKSELPKRHHYANNKRIDDVIVDVENEWLVTFRSLKGYNKKYCKGGNHGYDNIYKTMDALFLAHGPVFKQNLKIDPFENIELYNLMCDILEIPPAPNNGTEGTLTEILYNQKPALTINKPQNYTVVDGTFDKALFTEIINTTSCQQSCPFITAQDVKDMVESLQISSRSTAQSEKHVPLGVPSLEKPNSKVRILIKSEFVAAFGSELQSPVWVSYTLESSEILQLGFVNTKEYNCIIPDLRVNTSLDLTTSKKCQTNYRLPNNSYQWYSLINKVTTKLLSYGSLSSVYVPMFTGFKNGIWDEMSNLLRKWALKYKVINVMSGPIYDYNIDGRADSKEIIDRHSSNGLAIPTHLYFIVVRCEDASITNCVNLRTMSFIFPHVPDVSNCQEIERYLTNNEARLRDIELLTGLQFFTDLDFQKAVKLRTFLPSGLWN